MAANGGGPPFIKKEEDFDSNGKWNPIIMDSSIEKNDWNCKNRNKRGSGGISIAERRAAKNGFKMNGTTALSPPPYFTVPPGLSPSALLDSPVMLPNAQAHLSPTTGTFHEHSSPNNESLKLMKLKHGGNVESCEAPRVEEQNNIMGENKEGDFPRDDDMMLMRQKEEECFESNINRNEMTMMLDPSRNNNNSHHQKMNINSNGSSLLEGGGGAVRNMMNCGGTSLSSSEDGFLWRKYGQKHVKGSEYPRSYFKCTNTNCPVTKKVERSHNGYVAEIVYSGYHNHPQPHPHPHPHPSKRCCLNNSNSSSSSNNNNNNASSSSIYLIKTEQGAADHHHRVFDGTTTSPPSSFLINNNNGFLLQQPTASDDHHQNEASPDQSLSFHEELIDDEINNGECEATKRKRESESAGVGRSAREPKLVVQITSDIDILEDGYRWRKYGQKVVKGNPNPRSYYKCTTPGCPVRKHVERAATDIKSVITTYEGKHNHQLPSTKTAAAATLLISSDLANLPPPPAAAASTKPAKQQQQLLQDLPPPPLYLDRKPPILNYNNHLINFSTSSSGSAADLNFGPSSSSLYPLPFPPFHSLPYASLLMNTTNPINTYPAAPSSSNSKLIYPINMNIIPPPPEYMHMPTPIPSSSSSSPSPSSSQVAAGSSSHLPSFHYSSTSSDSYGAHHHHQLQLQPSSRGGLLQETRALVKPKEEQMRDNEDELYDTCLSIPNPPNAPI